MKEAIALAPRAVTAVVYGIAYQRMRSKPYNLPDITTDKTRTITARRPCRGAITDFAEKAKKPIHI